MSRLASRRLPIIIASLLLAAGSARGDSSTTTERTVTSVVDGVYAIRHRDAPDAFPQGNTTVIIGEQAVLVVDSCYLPSAAREDVAQIRQWTDKPVRYLLNTHWHFDHTLGNAAYRDAFPGLSVIAHAETRRQVAGYNPGWFARYPARSQLFRTAIETRKDRTGRALSDSEVAEYRNAMKGLDPVGKEFDALTGHLDALTPDTSFERDLVIDLGRREVQIKFLGRGNTAGDAIAFLPDERVVAAGDLVVHPVPYLGGGYPSELVATLERFKELNPAVIVPGHGEVLRGTDYVSLIGEFVASVTAKVGETVYRLGSGSKLEDVQAAVAKEMDVAGWRERFAGGDAGSRDTFDGFSFPGLARTAYEEAWRR
jgi:cyclase